MRKPGLTFAVLTCLFSLVFISGWASEKPPEKKGPDSALIVEEGLIQRDGIGKMVAWRIVSSEKLKELEAFFPNYEQRKEGGPPAGWEAGYRVYFNFKDGESVRVTVSENNDSDTWSTGRGDHSTRGDFKKFIDALKKRPVQ
ncbi:MAG: hypothetical protein O2820_00205 [Planctomycetota bacterium]|nr:hypothetical protein [Planctomycetota bacterium]MDA1247616.1 hypothetical protein [Planctomycetota bacterium]